MHTDQDFAAIGKFQAMLEAANAAAFKREQATNALRALLEDGLKGHYTASNNGKDLLTSFVSRHDFGLMQTALNDIQIADAELRGSITMANAVAEKAHKNKLLLQERIVLTKPAQSVIEAQDTSPAQPKTMALSDQQKTAQIPGAVQGQALGSSEAKV